MSEHELVERSHGARSTENGTLQRASASPMRTPGPARDAALGALLNAGPQARSLAQMKRALDASPRMRSQYALQRALGMRSAAITLQREALPEDEELAQAKSDPARRQADADAMPVREDEGQLQGKFAVAQRAALRDEDENAPAQLQGDPDALREAEEEEVLQGKLAVAQREPSLDEDEDVSAQRQGDPDALREAEEEDVLQGKRAVAQRQTDLDEDETLQGRFGPVQRHTNRTGLPDGLKAGVETLSGLSLDSVHVHYNSAQPATLQAAAYAQGSDIHVAPGQERHLPHEAWHVVQQMQGRVRPTMQAKGVPINDDGAFEQEADAMGAQALQRRSAATPSTARRGVLASDAPVQRRMVINQRRFSTLEQVLDDNVARGEYEQLNEEQKDAFYWQVRTTHDFQLADAAKFAATVEWMIANGLDGEAPFADMTPRDMVSMSFLVKEADYANWVHRAQAITFLLTLPGADASDFAHRYKAYYHLWRRFEKEGDNDPAARAAAAMGNVESALLQANAAPQAQVGAVGNLSAQQQYVVNMARANQLRFKSAASAATHFIKHGSYLLNTGGKISGEEQDQDLQGMGGAFIQHANAVIAYGTPQHVDAAAADGPIFRYVWYDDFGNQYLALAQYVTANAEAVLLSYFPSEHPDVVMDR